MKPVHLLLCVFLALAFSVPAAPAGGTGPNIVLILTDDLGYGDLGCYGATRVRTPHVDRLAAQGLRFTQAYAPASTCTPTRYALLTGEYAWRQRTRKTTILDGDAPLAIEPGKTTLPSLLRAAGYATGVVGKWHLGLGDGMSPVDFNCEIRPGPCEIGFDYAHIIPATVDRVPCVWIENHRVVGLDPADPIAVSYRTNLSDGPTGLERPDLLKQPADAQHSQSIINGISRIGYMRGGHSARFKDTELAGTVVRQSIEFMEEHAGRPFFLLVGMFEPHVPRVAEPRFVGTSDCGIRGDVIHQIDWQTGEIMAALDRLGLAEKTLVLFTSDNGPVFFDGYFDGSEEDANGHQPAGGLRGWKYLVYEGGTRVPLIARWPGRVPVGVSDRMFCLTDVLATCAALTDRPIPEGAAVDSLDQRRVLFKANARPVRDTVVVQGISGALAVRRGKWKYIPSNATAGPSGMGSGANPADKRFAEARVREPLLFDLTTDPGETTNLASVHPRRIRGLQRLLDRIRARTFSGEGPEAR